MESIRKKAKELLESNAVQLVIGYGEGSDNNVRTIFVSKPEDTDNLIYDERCVQNLAFYLMKHEVMQFGKIGLVAPLSVLRTILQLASENQIKEENVIILGIAQDNSLLTFNNFKDIQEYIATCDLTLPEKELNRIKEIEAMTVEERWKFWANELSRCIKCYACRSACPMCYCNRCQVECNQPQWITAEATPMGNFEWHLTRAMHLAGRCVNCGECARACPLDIPINLLTYKTVLTVKDNFNSSAGTSADMNSVLSTYKIDDKENFIH